MKHVGTHGQSLPLGFTLIEIAITLVIVGLLLAGMIGPMSVRIEQQERQKTQAMMEEIIEGLYGFAATNGRLPCPDTTGDGREDSDPNTTTCTSGSGNIPSVDLAVSRRDAWDRPFIYIVTGSFADDIPNTPATCPTIAAQASFSLCSDADLVIRDCDPGAPPATCPLPSLAPDVVVNRVPAVVISRGAHRFIFADASRHEQENFEDGSLGDTPGTVVARGYTGAIGQQFDDLVVWISPVILKNRMLMSGRLP